MNDTTQTIATCKVRGEPIKQGSGGHRPRVFCKEKESIPMATSEERRNKRFYGATITALMDIEERALHLPQDERYPAAYAILRGYFESLLTNFAEAFSTEQLAEIRIVLDRLAKVTGEDEHLNRATKARLDQLVQALRESEA